MEYFNSNRNMSEGDRGEADFLNHGKLSTHSEQLMFGEILTLLLSTQYVILVISVKRTFKKINK